MAHGMQDSREESAKAIAQNVLAELGSSANELLGSASSCGEGI
jgi:hypothetical protein